MFRNAAVELDRRHLNRRHQGIGQEEDVDLLTRALNRKPRDAEGFVSYDFGAE